MKLLVFGKTGQVAQELRHLAPDAQYLGREAADLSDPAACAAAIAAARPDAVINAAAWTAVDRAETEEAAALLVNATAPAAMARVCADLQIPFLHVSTDYVFDGSGQAPWRPGDATAPINAYGRTKRAGEIAVAAAGGSHLILRTSWVFSRFGANFVKTMLRVGASRDKLSVVCDQIGGPTPAGAIAAALLRAAPALRDGAMGGVHHFSGQGDTSWAGFARETFRAAQMAVEVEDILTSAYPTPAKRPLNSRLDCTALEADFGITRPDWTRALTEILRDMKESPL